MAVRAPQPVLRLVTGVPLLPSWEGGNSSGLSLTGLVARTSLAAVMFPIQGLAALGVLPYPVLGLYVLDCAWLLLLAAVTFATVLMLPRAA